jgi:hypothetical protein
MSLPENVDTLRSAFWLISYSFDGLVRAANWYNTIPVFSGWEERILASIKGCSQNETPGKLVPKALA